MKIRKKIILLSAVLILLLLITVAAFLLRRSVRQSKTLSTLTPVSDALVRGANGNSLYNMSVTSSGIFYIENGFMRYCDYQSGSNAVLCDKAYCLHNSASCGGWAKGMSGLACYDGKLYALIQSDSQQSYTLTEMSLSGENRKALASFDMTLSDSEGTWYLSDPAYGNDIYYGYGKAYLSLEYSLLDDTDSNYGNSRSKIQLYTVDLESGEKTLLAESTCMDIYHSAEFQAISEDYVLISVTENPDALLGEALETAISNGELEDLNEMLAAVPEDVAYSYWYENLAQFYMDYAVYFKTEKSCQLLLWDQKAGTCSNLYSGTCGVVLDDNGIPQYWQPSYECLGWQNGALILTGITCDSTSYQRNTAIYRWDLSEAQPELLADLGTGALPMMSYGSVGNYVRDGGKLIYIEYSPDGQTADTYALDLQSGESTFLFQDDADVTFRFLGETEDAFVGDMVVGDQHSAYLIRKEDYYAGNLDAAKLLLSDS